MENIAVGQDFNDRGGEERYMQQAEKKTYEFVLVITHNQGTVVQHMAAR